MQKMDNKIKLGLFSRTKKLVLVALLFALLIAVAYGYHIYCYYYGFNETWCRQQIAKIQPLIEALNQYKLKHKTFPTSLNLLPPETATAHQYLAPHPSNNNSDIIKYALIGDNNNYQISISVLHWAGSCDALVFRNNNLYPESWLRSKIKFNEITAGYYCTTCKSVYDAIFSIKDGKLLTIAMRRNPKYVEQLNSGDVAENFFRETTEPIHTSSHIIKEESI